MGTVSTCKKHPKYQGKLKPRVKCEDCELIYNVNKGQGQMFKIYTVAEIGNILYVWKNFKKPTKSGVSGRLIGYVKNGKMYAY